MSNKLPLPEPQGMAAAYKMLLKKEAVVKPASVTHRIEILNHMKRTNYKNEYDRLQGLLEGHADKFNIPGGHWQKDKLIKQTTNVKETFQGFL